MLKDKVVEQKEVQKKAEDLLDKERAKGLPIYVGDVEQMLEKVSRQVPVANANVIYELELGVHERVYGVLSVIGLLALLFGLLI